MDPGDAALRRCRCRCLLPPLVPSAAAAATAATAAVGSYCCRLQQLLPPDAPAAAVNCRLRHRRPLPLPPAIFSVRRCCCRCRCRLRPMSPLVTATAVGRSRRCPPWLARGHLDRWRRLWRPGQSWPSLSQSLRRIPEILLGLGIPHAGGALGPGDRLLPGGASVGGGPGSWPGAGDNGYTRPGRKGDSHALALLRLVQRLLNPETSLRLNGQAACRGPPPSGGYPHRGLCSMSLRSRCSASRPRHSPLGDLPARLADKAMQEVRKVGGHGVCGLGFPGVDICPLVLHFLASSEGGGRTP